MIRVIVAALAGGITAGSVVLVLKAPTRRLGPRVAPYAQRARLLMGQSIDTTLLDASGPDAGTRGRLLRPFMRSAARRLSALLDTAGDDDLSRRLYQAGWRTTSPDRYRQRQLAATVRGLALFAGVALVLSPAGGTVLVAAVSGGFAGAMRWRARLDKAIQRRRDQIRAELYTVAQLLAISVRAGTSPIVAIRELTDRGAAAVSADLRDALDDVDHGAKIRDALERLATNTPEPAAGRLYRLVATAEQGTGDTLADALLKMADDLRSQRREDTERQATRRRFQMLIPTVVVMAPVMLLLLGAPIPSFMFGD